MSNSREYSRRDFLRLAALSSAGAALASCSPKSAATPRPQTPSSKVQLVYQDWSSDWLVPVISQMLDQFHASHPNIRVFYTPDPDDVEESLIKTMRAGTGPDVFTGCCTFMPAIAQEGYALDLRPYVAADLDQATIKDWDPAQYKALFTRDGRQYGLPKYHGALALYFNRDLFDARHVDCPDGTWTHDDYLAAMKKVTAGKPRAGAPRTFGSMLDVSWDRIQVHINEWGGNIVDPADPTRCRMGEPPALAAMEWIRARMWDDHVMASFLDVQNLTTRKAFTEQRLAMVEDGSWALKDILTDAPFRIGVAPFPAGPARRATLATTDGYGIAASTKHPEAAWEFLKFLVSQDFGRALARGGFLQPARASLVNDWVGYVRQQFPEKAKDVDIAAFAAGHIEGYSVTAEIFADMVAAKPVAYAAWDRVFTQGQGPVDEMKVACAQIEATQQGDG
jgi:multiple sugar transport system substrate-binding protein